MPEITVPNLSFSLHNLPPSSSTSSSARTGTLTFTHHDAASSSSPSSPFSHSIQTPAIVHYTKKGAPVHLTRDNVDRLPIDMVGVAMEHFLDYNPPIFAQAPFSLTRYIGLRDQPVKPPLQENRRDQPVKPPLQENSESGSKQRNLHITIGSLRDPSDLVEITANTDQHVACRGYRGVCKITPHHFLSFALPRPPDILLALADEPLGLSHSQKRTTKSLIRSEKWLAQTLQAAKSKTNIFTPLIGGKNLTARHEYSATLNTTPHGDGTLASSVSGFCINLNTLRPSLALLASSPDLPTTQDCEPLITASLSPLPEDKPRLALCPEGPHEILRLIALGMDMFMDEWSTMLSSTGVALYFQFPAPTESTTKDEGRRGKQLGINLFSNAYSRDFSSLAGKDLNAELIRRYGREGLGDSPTRGYIHHLLHSHEMTSHVLLAMHNTCVMDCFLHGVRESIKAGSFSNDKKRFEEAYSEEMDCLEEAREEYMKVNRERGKGRLKGFGLERKDGAADTGVVEKAGTPANEQERTSVVDAVDQLSVNV